MIRVESGTLGLNRAARTHDNLPGTGSIRKGQRPDRILGLSGSAVAPLRHCDAAYLKFVGATMFNQILTPTGSMWSTIILALVPLAALLFMLAVLRITAWLATIIAGAITLGIGILAWHSPVKGSLQAYLYRRVGD